MVGRAETVLLERGVPRYCANCSGRLFRKGSVQEPKEELRQTSWSGVLEGPAARRVDTDPEGEITRELALPPVGL
jgi:hypothetical protein